MTQPACYLFSRNVLFAILLLTFTSCGENILGPLNNTVFALQTIDGVALPATTTDEFGGLAWIVVADTIWFESGSKWRRHSFQRREAGVGGDPLERETNGTVIRQGAVLILAFDCPDAVCITPDRAVGGVAGLEFEETYQHAGRRLVFKPI